MVGKLKSFFQVHLKLVHGKARPKSKPLLLFILRDCDESTTVEQLQVHLSGRNVKYVYQSFDLEFIVKFRILPHKIPQLGLFRKQS